MPYKRSIMPPKKSLIKITVQVNEDKLSLNLSPLYFRSNRFSIKTGRSKSQKIPDATITQVFDILRRWVVKRIN